MFGNFSYLLSTVFLAAPIILVEWLFFYHILIKNKLPVVITIILGLLLVSASEPFGIYLQAWQYGTKTTLPTFILGAKVESYLYVILGAASVSSLVMIYSHYEDRGIKNVFWQGIKDIISGKYAFWRKS